MPRTLLKVRIVEEKEVVRRGPYARFAQQYLGVVAPLSDRESYRIGAVSVEAVGNGRPDGENPAMQNGISIYSNVWSDTSFVRLPVDRTTPGETSQEQMAARAASALFTLRQRRFDLVTGEAGENVYGEGMKAALDQMAKIEEEYAALFMGKSYTVSTVKEFYVIPEYGRDAVVVCRFTEAKGIMPDADLSGRPVVMEFTFEDRTPPAPAVSSRGSRVEPVIYHPSESLAGCKITEGNSTLFEGKIAVYL